MTEEKARAAYDKALLNIKKCLTSNNGGIKAEVAYGVAWKELGHFGTPGNMKLKRKYLGK